MILVEWMTRVGHTKFSRTSTAVVHVYTKLKHLPAVFLEKLPAYWRLLHHCKLFSYESLLQYIFETTTFLFVQLCFCEKNTLPSCFIVLYIIR